MLPDHYPIREAAVGKLIERENRLGRIVDYGVIAARVDALYASSARALDEPLLLDLIQDGVPAYAWPADQRHVWEASASVAADIVDRVHHTAPQRHPPRTRASLEPQDIDVGYPAVSPKLTPIFSHSVERTSGSSAAGETISDSGEIDQR